MRRLSGPLGTRADRHDPAGASSPSSLILVFVGVAAGLVPALKASRLDPVEALRYE